MTVLLASEVVFYSEIPESWTMQKYRDFETPESNRSHTLEKHASAAKADFDLIGFIGTTESRALSKRRLRLSFSAACEGLATLRA
jgi:hypothetical protein